MAFGDMRKRLTIARTTRWRRDEPLYDRSTKAAAACGQALVLAGICGVTDRVLLLLLASMKLASTRRRRRTSAIRDLTVDSPTAVLLLVSLRPSFSSLYVLQLSDCKHNTHAFVC